MVKICDNKSVGVVIRDQAGNFALLKRAKFPVGIAPSAGHIDDHGAPEQAAKDEVEEELGLKLEKITPTAIYNRRVNNMCRRPGGDHHTWYIYEARVADTQLTPDDDETKGASWYAPEQLEDLVQRTRSYWAGSVTQKEWNENPGLEEVWVSFMEELGFVKGAS